MSQREFEVYFDCIVQFLLVTDITRLFATTEYSPPRPIQAELTATYYHRVSVPEYPETREGRTQLVTHDPDAAGVSYIYFQKSPPLSQSVLRLSGGEVAANFMGLFLLPSPVTSVYL